MPSPRSVLITGANRGIGFQLLQHLLKFQQRPEVIFATYRNKDNSKELLEIAEKDKTVKLIQLDVSDSGSYPKAVEYVKSVVGNNGLNLLINNAGILLGRHGLAAVTAEELMNTYAVNAVAPAMFSRAFLPLIKDAAKSGYGDEFTWSAAAIVNISTMLASVQMANDDQHVSYRMSKAALNMFTKCLSNELKGDKILVAAVHPGWVKTDMGGENAMLTKDYSADSILKTVTGLNVKSTGGFFNYDGSVLPY